VQSYNAAVDQPSSSRFGDLYLGFSWY